MKTTLVWLLIGLLVTANFVFASLYLLEKNETHNGVISNSDIDESNAQPLYGDTADSSGESTGKTTFESKVSNFSLGLSDSYVIIVEQDGGTSKSTRIEVGRKTNDDNGLVSALSEDQVKIEAYPTNVNGTRDEFVTSDTALQGNNSDETSASVDGMAARRFEITGVGTTLKYFFERNGITYLIEAWDVSSGDTKPMLDAVLSGFRFI